MGKGVDIALGVLFVVLFIAWANTPNDPSPAALLILFAIGAWIISLIATEAQD